MDLWMLILFIVLALICGFIPLVGVGYGFLILFLADIGSWTGGELILVLVFLLMSSVGGMILGAEGGFLSAGLLWLWSIGCFINFLVIIWMLGSAIWNEIFGTSLLFVFLALGVVGLRNSAKNRDRQCFNVLGKEFCIGKEI